MLSLYLNKTNALDLKQKKKRGKKRKINLDVLAVFISVKGHAHDKDIVSVIG